MSLSGSFFNAINRTNILRNMYERVNIYCAGLNSTAETLLGNYSEQKIEESKISLKPYEAMMLYRKR